MPLSFDGTGSITGIGTFNFSDEIVHVGDTNTKIRFPANDTITAETSGVERFRIRSDGKIGIGTDMAGAPASNYAFGVYRASGTGYLYTEAGASSASAGLRAKAGTSDFTIFTTQGTGQLAIYDNTNSAERLRIASDGKVGIGTDNPSGKLDILTGSLGGNVLIDAESSSGYHAKIVNDSGDLILGSRNTSGDTKLTSQRTLIFNSGSSEEERLRIDSNGKVAVTAGAIHPSRVLAKFGIDCQGLNIYDDVGVVANYGMAFYNDPTTDKANGIGFFNDDGQTCGGYIVHQDKGSGNLGDIVMATSATSNNPVERLRITSAGNVGIGTNAPSQIFNICGTNVKPVIGHITAHTPLYSSYDSQNNTGLEISSSGTGTNVAGLTINNPTTSANSSYKTISFSCSGTSSSDKRGCIISSNHDLDSSSAIKANFKVMVNNGSGLQDGILIGHQGHVQTSNTAMFSARGQNASWSSFSSGSGWFALGDTTSSGSNYTHNHSWTTSGTGCQVRGLTNAGNSIWNNSTAVFTAPVDGFYNFEISLYIRTNGGGQTMHVQPWIGGTNSGFYTSNVGNIRNSSNVVTGDTLEYPHVARSINLYLTNGQTFYWLVYAVQNKFESYRSYAHQSGYLIG